MAKITFQPSGKSIDVELGTELLRAASQAGIEIETPCGGEGTCGKCIGKIISGKVDSDSSGYLSNEDIAEGFVLTCRTKTLDTPLTIEFSENLGSEGGQFGNSDEDISLVRKELFPKEKEFEPLAKKIFLNVPEPKTNDGLSDIDRLKKAIQNELGKNEIVFPLQFIRSVADTLRSQGLGLGSGEDGKQ